VIPAIVGVTVGPVLTGVDVFAPAAVGVNRAGAVGDGVRAGLVGMTTNGVRFGSRPALGAVRDTNHSTTMMSAEAIDASAAPRNPRRVRATAAARLSAMSDQPGEHPGTDR
jgi:hypothetical protein